ncbi:MAG: LysM peptidoglycan-binding domain-containing protein [Muribaculaceae bacterium]|nr:LysM peptidoglycan-binding domain-containing protein [Roseburia sp.]MCM1432277.1 LysM peptidoglycan-binding domain-containing protein [Muribaculaceae bacterium]MCM1494053.1 LysM peptidoglycan-binding domain-containing protein [Muribaculaceae bacterium]
MIDIMTESEHKLKNVRQIGTPSEEDKIYIENTAYARIHADDFAERRIFIFMGHTEKENHHYTTFVEAAIPVPDIEFQQNVPKWSSHAWSDIFQEIKRSYDNSIIVGWAMDIKGFSPRLTPELEAVHREQFGGAHQVLFLMDSMEGEEHFYFNKGNCLQQKEGFFIYYSPTPRKAKEAEVTVEVPEDTPVRSGRSRLLMEEGKQAKQKKQEKQEPGKEKKAEKQSEHRATSYAMTAAILLLIGLVGAGVYQDRIKLSGLEEVVSTMGSRLEKEREADAEVLAGTEPGSAEETGGTENAAETLDLIPVKKLPSGEIQTIENAENAAQADDGAGGQTGDASNGQADDGAGGQTGDGAGGQADDGAGGQTSGVAGAQAGDSAPEDAETEDSVDAGATKPGYYIVRQGDTLTGISQKYYGSTAYIQEIAEANGLEDTDSIREGQKLLLP